MIEKHERPWLEGAKAAVGETSEQVDPTAPLDSVKGQPEAAELPSGLKPLPAVLQELASILPGLKAALELATARRSNGWPTESMKWPVAWDEPPRHREERIAAADSPCLTCTSERPVMATGNGALGSNPRKGNAADADPLRAWVVGKAYPPTRECRELAAMSEPWQRWPKTWPPRLPLTVRRSLMGG